MTHAKLPMLVMDTATTAMTVAWLGDHAEVTGRVTTAVRNHSIQLAPEIKQLFHDVQQDRSMIRGIACGIGPGSYTGVRIGVTVAKTMAWALNVPVWGVSSMLSLVWSGWASITHVDNKLAWLVPLTDARRGQAFTGWYEYDATNNRMMEVTRDQVANALEWIQHILTMAEAKDAVIYLIGDLDKFIGLPLDERIRYIQCTMNPEGMASAVRQVIQNELPTLAHDLAPNYTQLAEAERKWIEAQKPQLEV